MASFFDVDCSRALAWGRRPQAAALLAALADPDRGWDAIMVGEFERAFYGDQFEKLAPVFAAHGVQVWLPELDGPADIGNELHLSLLRMLGAHSRREVQRSRFRPKAAMRAQVEGQGRTMGGRPPYGYRLVDAGPHPNKAHARWGWRALRLDPDPETAPHVRWMFDQRLAGRSITSIARDLNERGVPCPSQADAERNPHRSGQAWIWQTVAAILANPRYTGRQTWNRQGTETGPLDDADDVLGRAAVRRWNTLHDWVISDVVVHPALVSDEDFVAVQAMYTTPSPADGSTREFVLTGLLFCQVCERRLSAHWVHGRPGYRCRHGHTSAHIPRQGRIRNVYVRPDQVLMFLAAHIPQLQRLDRGYDAPDAARTILARFQQDHELVIACNNYTWRLEKNGATAFDGWPPRLPRQKIPRQPRQAKRRPYIGRCEFV